MWALIGEGVDGLELTLEHRIQINISCKYKFLQDGKGVAKKQKVTDAMNSGINQKGH